MASDLLTMPRLGETMEEGKIVGWLIEPNTAFKRGQPILEVETDKTVAEFPALADGFLEEIVVPAGETVPVGATIAKLRAPEGGSTPTPRPMPAAEPVTTPPVQAPALKAAPASTDHPRATPIARRLAARSNLDLAGIAGTGRRGRIEASDIEAKLGRQAQPTPATLGEGNIAFDRHGAPDATNGSVLLLHGFGGDRSTFAAMASALARRGFDVIVPDLPGHGETTALAPDTVSLAAPLPAFLEALGAAPREIVAHSLGCVAAVQLAQSLPDLRRLTLLAPAGLGLEIDGAFAAGMAARPTMAELRHLLRRLTIRPVGLSTQALDALAASLDDDRLRALAADAFGPRGQRVEIVDALARLARRCDVRVVFGLEDRIVPWTHVASLPATVAIHLIAGAGHMPHWDRPDDVLALFDR